MSCIIWRPKKQAHMLYLELVPVLSYTDFSPFNERYKPIFWQPLIRNEQQKLLFGSKHNRETKKDNQQAPKPLVWGFYLDLCNCPTLKNTLSEKTVQILFFGNKFRSIQRILKVSGFIDSVSKCAMFYAKKRRNFSDFQLEKWEKLQNVSVGHCLKNTRNYLYMTKQAWRRLNVTSRTYKRVVYQVFDIKI